MRSICLLFPFQVSIVCDFSDDGPTFYKNAETNNIVSIYLIPD